MLNAKSVIWQCDTAAPGGPSAKRVLLADAQTCSAVKSVHTTTDKHFPRRRHSRSRFITLISFTALTPAQFQSPHLGDSGFAT
jgi:hypothetical protein